MVSRSVIVILSLISFGTFVQSIRVRRQGNGNANFAASQGTDLFSQILGAGLDTTIELETDGNGCGRRGGCHRGYCWTSCDATAFNNEWCYTTRGRSQDFNYIRCSQDSECDRCWSCAGSCTQ